MCVYSLENEHLKLRCLEKVASWGVGVSEHHNSTTYWLFKTTLTICRTKMTSIVLRKTQESFRKVVVCLLDHVIKFGKCFLTCVKT